MTYKKPGRKDGQKAGDGVWPYQTAGGKRYAFAVWLDTSDGKRLLKRGGFGRAGDKQGLDLDSAHGGRNHVLALVGLVKKTDPHRQTLGDLIFACQVHDGRLDLPDIDETRRRTGARVDLSAPSMPVGEFLDRWLDGRRQVKATTVAAARGCVETYLKPHLGNVPLDELTAEHVDAMLNWIERRNALVAECREAGERVPPDPLDVRRRPQVIKPASQRQVLAVLHAALNHAFKVKRFIPFNPMDQVEPPRVPESERPVWTTEEAARFLAFAENDRLAVAYRVVIVGGLRRGEVCALRWSDVDWKNRRLRVERQLVYLNRGWQLTDPKTGRRRDVSLDAETMVALKAHRIRQAREGSNLADLGVYRDDGFVFAHEDGTHLNPKMLTWHFQELSREAGLPIIHLHDLRHLSATLDLLAGTDIKVVSKRLGHARTAITQDLYQHVLDAMQDQAAEGRAALLSYSGPKEGASS